MRAVLLALTLGALALRVAGLGRLPLWIDEGHSLLQVTYRPFSDWFDVHPPLYTTAVGVDPGGDGVVSEPNKDPASWHYFRRSVAATALEAVRQVEADFKAWVDARGTVDHVDCPHWIAGRIFPAFSKQFEPQSSNCGHRSLGITVAPM